MSKFNDFYNNGFNNNENKNEDYNKDKIVISLDKKKILKFFEIIFIMFIVFVLVEIVCVFVMDKPLITFSTNKTEDLTVYKGLFFDTYKCSNSDKTKVKLKGIKYTCDVNVENELRLSGVVTDVQDKYFVLESDFGEKYKISLDNNPTLVGSDGVYTNQYIYIDLLEKLSNNNNKITVNEINIIEDNKKDYGNQDFTIIDNTITCLQGLEKVYSDGVYDYYLSCIKSHNVFIKFSNGDKVPIKEALWRQYVTPQQILDKGYNLLKEERSDNRGNFTIIDLSEICAESLEVIYDDGLYEYYLSCQKSSLVFVRFDNGEKLTMKEALNNMYVTPDQIINKKYNLGKQKKKVERGDFKIVEDFEGKIFAQAIEEVYKEGNIVCTYPEQRSGAVFIEFDNGEKYTIKEALNNKYITISQLKAKGYTSLVCVDKTAKRGDFKIVEDFEGKIFAQAIEEVYKEGNLVCTYSDHRSGAVFIVFDNGETYTIKEALNKKYITPDQLKAKGYTRLSCVTKVVGRGDFTIIDDVNLCAEALEEIYRDNTYKYYLSCQKSSSVFVKFENGEKYTLKVALAKKYVTPEQVINKKYNLIKKPIARGDFKIIEELEGKAFAQSIEEVYKEGNVVCTYPEQRSGAVFIEFDNGEKYTIKEALNNKYITIAQLKAKGYTNLTCAEHVVNKRGNFKIIDESATYSCASVVKVVFENNKWICYNVCGIFVKFDNGEKYSVNEALKNGYVTPEELQSKGYIKSCKLK